ncbi:hypothetical protein PMAYCL1PPCAC_20548, partial [Pristionchus mayeri]
IMIILSIHVPLLVFGLITGFTLLLAIIRATPAAVKNYSVLLFWCALNDLISVTVDLISMERYLHLLENLENHQQAKFKLLASLSLNIVHLI